MTLGLPIGHQHSLKKLVKVKKLFAFKVCKHVKSNAIIYVKNKKTIGIGAGQMSRVDSARIASQKNSKMEQSDENSLQDSIVASDAFPSF